MDIKELNLTDEQMALVSKYVQSETDKVRTDYSAKLKTANDEIARLKPVEKSDAEKALEERISALESKEKELANKEKSMTLASKLKEKELPEGLAQFLNVGEDIEHWTDAYTAISFWNVYYPTYVEHWDNEGGEMRLTSTDNSVGLPIHYHNFNDEDYNFGVALLNDIKPIMDALEDVMAKMSDSIYVNVMNPMPVAIGQRIESSIPADAVGYVMNLDVGDFKYANCSLDYNSIKLYLDNMKQFLNDVACMPSVLGSSTNIANISEVSMQILLMMASVYADENKKWLNIGFQKRFEMFKKILGMQGIKVDSDVEVIYNVAMPVASTEMIANLKTLQEMGAISKETIMEKTEYVSDVEVEKKRLSGENVKGSPNGEQLKTTDNVDNSVDNLA